MNIGLFSRHTLLAVVAACASSIAAAGPSWITIGNEAHALLLGVAPQAVTLSTQSVPVTVPERAGSRTLVRATDTVHAVEIDEDVLPALSQAVHEELRRCGGFVRHGSMAEALAVLHRLQGPQQADGVAPNYVIDNVAQVTPLLAQVQSSNILSTIQSLSDFQNRMYNSSHGVSASNWLFNTWKQLAGSRRDVTVKQITHSGWMQKSVSLVIRGSGNARETVVLGGHLDSISSGSPETLRAPGADDDASGVASLTEVIRVLMAANYKPKRTIEFIAYSAEEVGLRGSQEIAARYAKLRKSVVGVLQLDMTAYQGDATDLWIYTDYTNTAQNQFVADLATAYLPDLTVAYDRCGYACSDHASWTGKGYAASFPFESSFSHYNHLIHTPNDLPAAFGDEAGHALKFSRLALSFAVELGSDMPAAGR